MRRQQIIVASILAVFAAMYALLAFGNHLNFRTYCLDLGQYTNAMWDYAHGRVDDCSAYLWEPQNTLADHFDLYVLILSPLVFIFGQYTLLIVQLLAVLFGALGIYRLVGLHSDTKLLPTMAMLSMLGFFGVWHAMGFDYHSDVVAAMLLPWFLYYFKRGKYGWATALIVLISIAKETMPLWIFFIALALLWDYRKDKRAMLWLAGYIAYATIYFVVVGMVVMPSLGKNSQVLWRYDYMGDSFDDIAAYILTHPWQTLVNFLTNFTHDPGLDGIKAEFWICAALSGLLIVALRKPNWLLMIVPCVAMKMLVRGDPGFWGITFHYNAALAPVLVAGAFIGISGIRWQKTAAIATTVLVLLTTFYTTNHPIADIRRDNLRIDKANHYRRNGFDKDYAYRLLAQIPDDASVCATTMFVPHLATRDSVYMFPIGMAHRPEYFLLLNRDEYYYECDQPILAKAMADTAHYEVAATDGTLYLLKRKSP